MDNDSKTRQCANDKENLPPVGNAEKFVKPRQGQDIHNEGLRGHLRVVNPNTNEVYCTLPALTMRDVDHKNITAAGVGTEAGTLFDIVKDESLDFDSTPMSLSDFSSPMSLDFSSDSLQLTDDSLYEEKPSRNDCQRCYEVVDYQKDILKRFQESEINHVPKAKYMRFQNDINHNMRSIVIDWLVDVAEEYQMDTETLYLSVYYMDRFLSEMAVVRSKLQLVGVTALYIAAKYEEVYSPRVSELLCNTDNCYTKEQMLHMEQAILKTLSFNLCTPTAYVFINAYSVLCNMTEQVKYLTLFLCELSLMEGDTYLKYLPSRISSAALALSRHMLGMEIWSSELQEITTYALDDLKNVVLELCQTHKTSKTLKTHAIWDKYNREKYQKVASIEAKDQLDELCLTLLEKENLESLGIMFRF